MCDEMEEAYISVLLSLPLLFRFLMLDLAVNQCLPKRKETREKSAMVYLS